MGLDITAYRRLKPAPNAKLDADGNPLDWERHFKPYINDSFPGRAEGIDRSMVYSVKPDNVMGFRGGSYSGYNEWREWLAELVGYPVTAPRGGMGDKPRSHGAWAAHEGPFWEMINFSDCEGVIGPIVAAKLAKDFAEYDDRAKTKTDGRGWYYEQYQKWREAFEMAADGGAVDFH